MPMRATWKTLRIRQSHGSRCGAGARLIFGVAGATLAAALMLAGCGSSETPPAGAKPAATLRKAPPANLVSPNMVAAVSSGTHGGASSVQVKFELRGRPQVATPLDIDLVIVPVTANVDRVSGKLEVGDGLELAEGAEIPAADRPPEGIPITHTVKVLPKRDGIFTVTATLAVDAAGVSTNQTFAIPVIVGGARPRRPRSRRRVRRPAPRNQLEPPLSGSPPLAPSETTFAELSSA